MAEQANALLAAGLLLGAGPPADEEAPTSESDDDDDDDQLSQDDFDVPDNEDGEAAAEKMRWQQRLQQNQSPRKATLTRWLSMLPRVGATLADSWCHLSTAAQCRVGLWKPVA